MTNTSAMTALQTLQMTNQQLDKTQNEISTGYKVASASDNAAYWSIATTMRSDNNSLSTVNDALGLGSATVNTAYTAMNSVKDTLDKIKSDLVTATQPGVDKSKIQADITEQLQQLQTYANAAGFSGNNWLSVNSTAGSGYNATQSVVSSFTRSNDGTVSLGTIDVDITNVSLFDANTSGAGLLQKGQALDATNVMGALGLGSTAPTEADSTTAGGQGTLTFATFGGAVTLGDNDVIQFDLTVNGGDAKTVTIDKATVDAALNTSDGKISSAGDFGKVMAAAVANAGLSNDLTVDTTDGKLTTVAKSDGTSKVSVALSNINSSNNGNIFNVMDINITNSSENQLNNYLQGVDKMFQNVTTAASDLGAVQSRISSQQTFVQALMDSIDSGVGSLVDADMNEASTRLKALQTQQQLGIQALSIANSNSQNILSLFR
jgi:flagellin